MTVTVLDGQTIYDITVQYYGSTERVEWLLQDNDLTIDSDLSSGQQLEIRDLKRKNNVVRFYSDEFQSINNSDNIKISDPLGDVVVRIAKRNPLLESARSGVWIVHDGQSIYDVAVMFYGSPDKVDIFLEDNEDLNRDSSLFAGQEVNVRVDEGNVEKFDIVKDKIIINNADNIERILGELRAFVRTIGAEKNGNDGYVLIDVYAGEIPYTYLWSNGQTTQNLIGVTEGTYTVTVTDAEDTEVVLTVYVPLEVVKDLLVDNPQGRYIITDNYDNILVNS